MEADQAQARRGAGGERPLLGVPIAVKDDIDVAGEITAFGTNAYGEPARADAEVVRRLREAGAVIIGKTNVPELTLWPFTETATFGATRNPWDRQRAPGGSSGGSAAAVAAGLVGAALGSDGAGSIRIPAAWCGLFGLKPQRGRVSMAPRGRPWYGLSVNGVLTRRVLDTALFHDVASGAIDSDSDSAPAPPAPFVQLAGTPPRPLKIAFSRRVPFGVISRLDADAGRALDEIVALLRSLGHELTEHDPDYGIDGIQAVLVRYLRGAFDDAHALPHPERLERRTRGIARLGGLIPPAVVQRGLAGEAEFSRRLNGVLADHEVLLTPATATPPAAHRPAAGARRDLDAERGRGDGPLQRRLERHRPASRGDTSGLRRRRPAPRGADGAHHRRAARPVGHLYAQTLLPSHRQRRSFSSQPGGRGNRQKPVPG